MAEQKKYWIKLEKDFLNSSQIKVIKNMQNGKDYIIFYLALMLESTNTEGHLRFNEIVPYNEDMLASVTDTNVDIVRSAMKIFQSLGLIQILENGTIFLPDVPKRVGKECESAERVRLYRASHKMLQCNEDVTNCNDNKEKEKEKEKDKKEDKNKEYATAVSSFLQNKSDEFKNAWNSFLEFRKGKKGKDTGYALYLITKDLEKFSSIESEQLEIINNSIKNKWTGVFALKGKTVQTENKTTTGTYI